MGLSLIETGKGTTISINEFGDPDGFPIIINHGMIASITDNELFSSLVEAGKRIVCIARPGYGASSPFELQNVGEWGKVVNKIVHKMNLMQFDTLGISSGAPYSYAIAYEIPEKVRNVYIFSGTPALFDSRVVKLWPYPIDAEISLPALQVLAKNLFFSNGAPKENKALIDSYRNECFGIALDLKIRCRDWGFALSKIKTKVTMEHSINDTSAPFAAAELTSKMLGNCKLLKRKNGDHFSKELLNEFLINVVLKQ